jgi:hypothetical protein
MHRASVSASLYCLLGTTVLLLPLLLVGCGGGNLYSVNEGQVAQRFLPPERTVHHPDSLQDLAVTEGDNKLKYQLERDYQSLIQKWSSSYRRMGAGRSVQQSRTYATFWSLELALASLQPEAGIVSLRKEKARELLERRRESYDETIRIEVYWFTGRGTNGIIAGPSARTVLRVGDRRLRPTRADHGPLREAYVSGGQTALYRRNTLHFPRTVEGTDVLADSAGVELTVRRSGLSSKEQFSWTWEEERQ